MHFSCRKQKTSLKTTILCSRRQKVHHFYKLHNFKYNTKGKRCTIYPTKASEVNKMWLFNPNESWKDSKKKEIIIPKLCTLQQPAHKETQNLSSNTDVNSSPNFPSKILAFLSYNNTQKSAIIPYFNKTIGLGSLSKENCFNY